MGKDNYWTPERIDEAFGELKKSKPRYRWRITPERIDEAFEEPRESKPRHKWKKIVWLELPRDYKEREKLEGRPDVQIFVVYSKVKERPYETERGLLRA